MICVLKRPSERDRALPPTWELQLRYVANTVLRYKMVSGSAAKSAKIVRDGARFGPVNPTLLYLSN